MKVIVIGAGEWMGDFVIKKLADTSHDTIALTDNDNRKSDLYDLGADEVIVSKDGEGWEQSFPEGDAVIYVSQASPRSGEDKTIAVDVTSVQEVAEAAKHRHINRFVLLSSIRSDEMSDDRVEADHFQEKKEKSERFLREEGMTYTIIRPGLLVSKPGHGKVNAKIASESKPLEGELSIEDAAAMLVKVIEEERVYNKTIEITNGDVAIEDVFQTL